MKVQKMWGLALFLGIASTATVPAQTVIKGKVTDTTGEPMIGATITLSSSPTIGATAQFDGTYQLNVNRTLSKRDSLIFQYVGYKRQAIAYQGVNTIDAVLQDESVVLNNVVITALGIKREEKGLGYATQTVSGEDITKAMPSNWSLALQGEVAGLNVVSAGGPLSSTQIKLRGDVSLNSTGNGALIVVDGVPLSSPMNNPGGSYGAGGNNDGSVDYGNGFSDLNPDDIESI